MCYFNGRFNQLGRFSDYLLGDECLSFLLVYFMVRAVFFTSTSGVQRNLVNFPDNFNSEDVLTGNFGRNTLNKGHK